MHAPNLPCIHAEIDAARTRKLADIENVRREAAAAVELAKKKALLARQQAAEAAKKKAAGGGAATPGSAAQGGTPTAGSQRASTNASPARTPARVSTTGQ